MITTLTTQSTRSSILSCSQMTYYRRRGQKIIRGLNTNRTGWQNKEWKGFSHVGCQKTSTFIMYGAEKEHRRNLKPGEEWQKHERQHGQEMKKRGKMIVRFGWKDEGQVWKRSNMVTVVSQSFYSKSVTWWQISSGEIQVYKQTCRHDWTWQDKAFGS